MKPVMIKYGREGLALQVPDRVDIFQPNWQPAFSDERSAIFNALIQPYGTPALRDLLNPHMQVMIAHTDLTRATPNERLLMPILTELQIAGIPVENVTLINALGSHRQQSDEEMKTLLGEKIFKTYRCIQHDAFDVQNNVNIAKTINGQSVRINRHFVEADFRILTGFIEPHFFAGFSGGPKLVLPGLADVETIQWNHRPESIASAKATWGVTTGNPIWEEIREVAKRFDPLFNVNVTLNEHQQINGVFCGDLLASHTAGCEFVRTQSMFSVAQPYDLVITGNSGYPLDQNLYQSIKGMCAAAQITRQGGQIIMAAACEDGLPEHGLYAQILAEADSPQRLLENILHSAQSRQDQWQVLKQAMIQTHFDVGVFSQGLSAEQLCKAHFRPVENIEVEISRLLVENPQARIAVLPEGPLSIGRVLEKEGIK
jgi:lactate racemase